MNRGFSSVAQMVATPGATWAHRGGSANWPEMSAYAYAQSAAAGYGALEFSCARSSDGVWFGLHDESINRVAETTGLPAASAMTWAEIQAHEITLNAEGTPRPFMLLTDFLSAYGDTHVCIVDPKHGIGSGTEFLDLLDLHAPKARTVVKFFGVGGGSTSLADKATARGYETWGYFYEADYTDGDLASSQSHWSLLGMEYTASQEAWDATLSYGKPVVGHIAPSLVAYNQAIARGARMVQCSDVLAIPAVGAPASLGINEARLYDFEAWIKMAPNYDWSALGA